MAKSSWWGTLAGMEHQRFTPEAIAEFIEIWADEFDEYITEDQAVMEIRSLLEVCRLLVQPLPDEPGDSGSPSVKS